MHPPLLTLIIAALSLISIGLIYSIYSLPDVKSDILNIRFSSNDLSAFREVVTLPKSTWPVSIRDEDGNFEEIVHPGDKKTKLSVPCFWSDPLLNGNLMSSKLATKIGTYVDGETDIDPKSKGLPDERTIFVGIASYRDWQCRYTVESIFNRAKFPNRIRVGVIDQITQDEGDPSCGIDIKPCNLYPD